ncbi:unnamed protein product [Urochloa humidicola]
MSSPMSGRRRSRDSLQQMDAAQAPPVTSDERVVTHRPVAVDGRQYGILRETRTQSPAPYEDAEACVERHSRVVDAFLIFEIESELSQRRRCKRPRVAASSDAVLGLQEARAGDAGSRTPAECAVCLQDFVAEDALRAMPCSHTFHQDCIFRWLRVNHVCPLCRHALPTQEQDDQDQEYDDEGDYLQDELNDYYDQMIREGSYDQSYGGEYYNQHYGDGNYEQESMPVPDEA